MVMGDLIARVGNNVVRCEGVIGKQGEDVENDSGRRLLSFSAENSFKVLNTFYKHNEGDTQIHVEVSRERHTINH